MPEFDETGQCKVGGCLGACPGCGCSNGSSQGVSNLSRNLSKNGKVQAGSDPGLLILLGINLSGKAARISEPTRVSVSNIARTIRKRYPFRLRSRNLKNIIPSSLLIGIRQSV